MAAEEPAQTGAAARKYDVIVVGAGFAGLYSLYRFRKLGYSVRVLEAGDGIGGTWFWNRYPGARCDIESVQYSFSFSEDIQQEWHWSERYASQPEILRYIEFVADRLDLRKDIDLKTPVTAATFDDTAAEWTLTTQTGERLRTRFCIMATGCLSIPIDPIIPGVEDFGGKIYRTMRWPREGVDLSGQRVGLIGTGATGVQATPLLAEQSRYLTIFQRTANFSIPSQNRKMDPDYEADWKAHYAERRQAARGTRNNALMRQGTRPGKDMSDEELNQVFEERWRMGGLAYMYGVTDFGSDKRVNDLAAEFVRRKIAETVKDPETARKLMPHDHPIGTKRLCVDSGYYETFNRDNVTLVDLRDEPLATITARGVRTTKREYELDVLVLATGFDAMTGALKRIKITGRGGLKLRAKWQQAPKTLLGVAIAGFPNMFTITGPGSPSVFSNMVTSIEQNVDWIAGCIEHMRTRGYCTAEARSDAEDRWFAHVNEMAQKTLLGLANSWFVGANVSGKPRVVMPYAGGVPNYLSACEQVARSDYDAFELR